MISLQTPKAREIFDIQADQAVVDIAGSVIRTMIALPKNLTIESAVFIAREVNPGLSDIQAVAELQKLIDGADGKIRAFKTVSEKRMRDEYLRIGAALGWATNCLAGYMQRIPVLRCEIQSVESKVARKIEALVEAGVSLDEATRAAGDCGEAFLREELERITKESERLQKFLLTKDESDLPPDAPYGLIEASGE